MKYVFSMTLALALLASAPALGQYSIDVMTQNQYLGADLNPVINASPGDFNDKVIETLEQVAFNDIESRAHALAELIAKRLPALVGLQEVFDFGCTDLGPRTPDEGCDNPRIRNAFNDHLGLTMGALADLGETYMPVATVVNFNTSTVVVPPLTSPGVPFNIDGFDAVVNFMDRDVILVRGDLADGAEPVDFMVYQPSGICLKPSADGCNYQFVASAKLAGAVDLDIERGFVGVDVNVDGIDYRFINTHLEVQRPDGTDLSSIVQAAQAQELISTLANTTNGQLLIVVGDINSSSEDPLIFLDPPIPAGFPSVIVPPYTQFIGNAQVPGAGYTDAWDFRPGNQPGYTCCQEEPVLVDDEGNPLPGSPLPGNLLNQQSNLDERIDVIFSLHELSRVKKARVLGAKVSDKTPPAGLGLWPSDHGSVAAELQFD